MPVSPEEILSHADTLCASSDEASYRSSISRAYYANYHKAHIVAQEFELRIGGGTGVHQALINSFRQRGASFDKIANKLSKLKMARVKSDYELAESITKKEAELVVLNAKSLLQDIQRLLSAKSVQE